MGFFLPFLSAGTDGIGAVFDKLNLRKGGIGLRPLLVLEFAAMFVIVGSYVAVARPTVPHLSSLLAGVLLIIILLSFAQNVFELKGMQAMDMNVREPIVNLEPILTGILAHLLFPSESNIGYLAAIIVGVFLIMWSTKKRFSWRHLFSTGGGYVFADISLSAVLDNLLKFCLYFISAVYIPFFRTGGVLLLSLLFMRPSWKRLPSSGLALGIVSGMLFGIAALTKALAVQRFGLNFTILVMLLEPGVIYLLSYAVLRERFQWRPIVSTLGIICLILLVR